MAGNDQRRKKIYIGSADREERADDTALLRKLVVAAYEHGLALIDQGKPAPDSFVDLFGAEATISPGARRMDPEAFRFASMGGAIKNREQLLLNLLSGRMEANVTNTETIKESILADIHCVSTIENPIDLLNVAKSK